MCQIKADIKGFLLIYRLYLYKHWFFPNFELKDFLEYTVTPCRLILEGKLKCLSLKMTFNIIPDFIQSKKFSVHLIPFSHFFKYFSVIYNLIWPYFECFKVSQLINLLRTLLWYLFFDGFCKRFMYYFWATFTWKMEATNNRNKCGVKQS